MQSRSIRAGERATGPTRFALLGITVLLARLLFLVAVSPSDGELKFGPDGWLTTATHLAEGGGYSFPDAGTPTARRGPTVVLYFTAIVSLFGESQIAIILGQWLMDILSAYLLMGISHAVFPGKRWTSTLAVLLFAVYPPSLYLSTRAWSEPVVTACFLGFTLALLGLIEAPSPLRGLGAGVLLGLAALANPMMLFLPLAALPVLLLLGKGTARRTLASGAPLLLGLVLSLSPWIVRNTLVFGSFIPGSTIGGLPLLQSHFALGSDDFTRFRSAEESMGVLRSLLEEQYGPEPAGAGFHGYVRAHGLTEVDVNRIAMRAALRRIREHPGRYLHLCALRVARIWLHLGYAGGNPAPSSVIALVNGPVLLLAALSFFLPRGGWRRRAIPLAVLVLFHTFALAAVFGLGRYCAPMAPLVLLLAAHTLVGIVGSNLRPTKE